MNLTLTENYWQNDEKLIQYTGNCCALYIVKMERTWTDYQSTTSLYFLYF